MTVAGATTGVAVFTGFLIAFSGSGFTALTTFSAAFFATDLTLALTWGFAVGFAIVLAAGLTGGLAGFGAGFTPFLVLALRPGLTTALAANLTLPATGLALVAGFLTATGFSTFLAAGLAAFMLLVDLLTFAAFATFTALAGGLGAVFVFTADLFAGLALDLAAFLASAFAGILAFFAGTFTVCLL